MASKKNGDGEDEKPLEPKQEDFCQQYLIDLNGAQAAIRAGYSEATAKEQASRLLTKVNVQNRVAELMAERQARTRITADRVLQEYVRLGLFDPRKLFKEDGSPKAINELDDDTAAAIAGLETVSIGNEETKIGQVLKYKVANKLGALDSMAKHLGMFPDKLTLAGDKDNPLFPLAKTLDERISKREEPKDK